ncbi:MAG: HAMP domain-containing histidine kinase [Ruminococcaceae bacterium]|nr:HAMP domain-containing histidine kinase [Oscillospiraceae bacterium]
MEESKNTVGMLDLLPQPAFSVKDGMITQINAAGKSCLIPEGQAISELLHSGKTEYAAFQDGCLFLTLCIDGQIRNATVSRVDHADIFVLEQDNTQAELQAIALAAQELRHPLANVMTIADRLFPIAGKDDDAALQEQVARINRGLFQMLRIIGNMSDAYRYSQDTVPHPEIRDISALVREIFDSAAPMIQQTGIELEYSVPDESIFCLVDAEKLERAINNLLSNALKFSKKGGLIYARLVKKAQMLYLTVEDTGSGIPSEVQGNLYFRYLRQPGIEDGRYGIGLGMVLIRAAATAHGGTVLMQQLPEAGTRITLTIPIRQNTGATVRSPLYRIDYAGELDHKLIELSESLPLDPFYSEK